MNACSTIAAVTVALRTLIHRAVPSEVEVTNLSPRLAADFGKSEVHCARINLVLIQISPDARSRNVAPELPDTGKARNRVLQPLELQHLITAYGEPSLTALWSVERLLESAECILNANPVLTEEMLNLALPTDAGDRRAGQARVVPDVLTLEECCGLFRSLLTELRPSLVYRVFLRRGDP